MHILNYCGAGAFSLVILEYLLIIPVILHCNSTLLCCLPKKFHNSPSDLFFQARDLCTTELAAIKVIKLEPG